MCRNGTFRGRFRRPLQAPAGRTLTPAPDRHAGARRVRGLTPDVSRKGTFAVPILAQRRPLAGLALYARRVPRAPRLQLAGGIYHVMSRGNRRAEIFRSEPDYVLFLALLSRASREFRWDVFAYCLMPNHFHIVMRTRDANVAGGMQRLKGVYAELFNGRYGLDGHVFQGRYKSVLVTTEPHALELARYVVLNPVRAGLCLDLCEWRWSSYRPTAGLVAPPTFLNRGWVLGHFGGRREQALRSYAAFVADGLPRAPAGQRSGGHSDTARAGVPPRYPKP